MQMFIITWSHNGKIWDSERYADTAKEALAKFRKDVETRRATKEVSVLGVRAVDAKLSLMLVAA